MFSHKALNVCDKPVQLSSWCEQAFRLCLHNSDVFKNVNVFPLFKKKKFTRLYIILKTIHVYTLFTHCWRSVSKLLSSNNSTVYSGIVVFVCSCFPLKLPRTAHVNIPNTYYVCAWRHHFQRFLDWVFTQKRQRCRLKKNVLWNQFYVLGLHCRVNEQNVSRFCLTTFLPRSFLLYLRPSQISGSHVAVTVALLCFYDSERALCIA